jgi:hypothetical protein
MRQIARSRDAAKNAKQERSVLVLPKHHLLV